MVHRGHYYSECTIRLSSRLLHVRHLVFYRRVLRLFPAKYCLLIFVTERDDLAHFETYSRLFRRIPMDQDCARWCPVRMRIVALKIFGRVQSRDLLLRNTENREFLEFDRGPFLEPWNLWNPVPDDVAHADGSPPFTVQPATFQITNN